MATPELYNLILSFRFDIAEERCRTHPLDVEWRCARGYTPLHRLVCHRGVASVAVASVAPRRGANGGGGGGDPILRTARAMLRAADAIGFEGTAPDSGGPPTSSGAVRLASDRGNRALWSPLHLLCQLGVGYGEDGADDLVRCLLLLDDDGGWGGRTDHGYGNRPRARAFGGDDRAETKARERTARHLASLRDRQGRTALHLLCNRHVPPDDGTVEALVSADPSLVLCRDGNGDTPLSHLVRCREAAAVHRFVRYFLSIATTLLFPDAVPGIGMRPRGECRGGDDDDDDGTERRASPVRGPCSRRNLVHSAVRMPAACCPPCLVVRFVASERPRFVKEWDEDGNLPLHVLASARDGRPPSSYRNPSDRTRARGGGGGGGTSRVPSRGLSPPRLFRDPCTGVGWDDSKRTAVERANAFAALLRVYPESASLRNGSGKLPLELASAAGATWDCGISHLLTAAPSALAAMELDAGMYPRILAFAGRRRGGTKLAEIGGLTLMFELVRARPDLAENRTLRLTLVPPEERKIGATGISAWRKALGSG